MWRKIPDTIKLAARDLRKSMTEAEKILWEHVKDKKISYKINRQTPIYLYTEDSWVDRYIIVDFYCAKKKLIIELDWWIHDIQEIYILDKEKEKLLLQSGYKILRFKNKEIFESIDKVISKIQDI